MRGDATLTLASDDEERNAIDNCRGAQGAVGTSVSLHATLHEVEFGASIRSPARARPRSRTAGAYQPPILHTVSYINLLPGLLITQYTKTPSSRSTGYLLDTSGALRTHTRAAESLCLRSVLSRPAAAPRTPGGTQSTPRATVPPLTLQRRPAREDPAQEPSHVLPRTMYESWRPPRESM